MQEILRYKLTYGMIALNVLVYLWLAFLGHSVMDMDIRLLLENGALFGPLTIGQGEWWRLFTAMFLHGGLMHIAMNMFSLYLIGRGAEMYFDTKSYLSIYLFSGLIGGLTSLFVHPESVGVGASGAIFGVFGALAGFFLAHREQIETQSKAFMKDFGIIIGINLVIGFSIPEVDVSAHIGGLLVGVLGGFLIARNFKFWLLYSSAMALLCVAMASYLTGHYVSPVF